MKLFLIFVAFCCITTFAISKPDEARLVFRADSSKVSSHHVKRLGFAVPEDSTRQKAGVKRAGIKTKSTGPLYGRSK